MSRLQIIGSDSGWAPLGVRFRKTRSGPESELVENFLANLPLELVRGSRATIFREPRLESGFPDLVVVVWRESVTKQWSEARKRLQSEDLRIAQYLLRSGNTHAKELSAVFGRGVTEALDRLETARIARKVGKAWRTYSLSTAFSATKIIAIEAKVGKWSDVLRQARLNMWFASKSYVLVPRRPGQAKLKEASRVGVGVCSMGDDTVRDLEAAPAALPKSYASWLLCELAWRYSNNFEDSAF